jgi:hypothetical protein
MAHSREGGWDTGVDKFSSIVPNRRILIESPLDGEAGQKNLAKSKFSEFTSM